MNTILRETQLTEEILGIRGRLISGSKSGYRRAYPDHVVVFNANLCTGTHKFWYGDIDITLDSIKLQELCNEIGESIYVLTESDGRFENEHQPHTSNAIAYYNPIRNEEVRPT
jgi:hypothetical protein